MQPRPRIMKSKRNEDKIIIVLNRLESCANCRAYLGDDEESKRNQLRFTDQIHGYCTLQSVSQAYKSIFKNLIKPNIDIDEEFYSKLRLCSKCSSIFSELLKLFWEFVTISCKNESLLSTILDIKIKEKHSNDGENNGLVRTPTEFTIKYSEPPDDDGETFAEETEEFIESSIGDFEDLTNTSDNNDDPEYEPLVKLSSIKANKFPVQKDPILIQCTKCDRVFSNRKYLLGHLKRITPCDKQTKNEVINMEMDTGPGSINSTQNEVNDELESQDEYESISNHHCKICQKIFSSSKYLHHHMRSHLKKFQCKSCKKRFRDPYELRKHEMSNGCLSPHNNAPIRNIVLDLDNSKAGFKRGTSNKVKSTCLPSKPRSKSKKKFHSSETYDANTIPSSQQNDPDKESHLCHICSQTFTVSFTLARHLKSHSKEAFMCSYPDCIKEFNSKDSLQDHINVHNKDKVHKCPKDECDRAYCTRKSLAKHLLAHKRFDENPETIICEICASVFTNIVHYSQHKRLIHSESRRLNEKQECPICKIWVKNLEHHKITHKWTKILKFPCSTCGRSFDTEKNLKNHEIYNHSIAKNNICPEPGCKRAFTYKYTLKKHMKQHVVGKPFVCTVEGCKSAYKYKMGLKLHIDVHHKYSSPAEFPHECLVCKERFARQCLLNNHRKRRKHIFLTDEEKKLKGQESVT